MFSFDSNSSDKLHGNFETNSILEKIFDYILSKINTTEVHLNEFHKEGVGDFDNSKSFLEIYPTEVPQIKKSLNNIAKTLKNSSCEREFIAFSKIRDMHIYILDNSPASDEVLSFLIDSISLFEKTVAPLFNKNSFNSIEYNKNWELFDEKLFEFEEYFYEKYYNDTNEYDELIQDTTRILLG